MPPVENPILSTFMDLSLAEVARLLGKSERQVRYLIVQGKLPARKVGRKWSVRRQDLPLSDGQKKAAAQKTPVRWPLSVVPRMNPTALDKPEAHSELWDRRLA